MRRFTIIIFFLLLIVPVQTQSDFDAAQTAYESGDFMTARTIFETMLATDEHNTNLYYNLAVTCYQMNDDGCAILNIKRALHLQPRDIELQTTLAQFRAGADLPPLEYTEPLLVTGTMSNSLLTETEFITIVLMLWCVCWSLILMYFWLQRWRDLLRLLLIVPVSLLIATGGVFAVRSFVENIHPEAILMTDNTVLRTGAGTDFLDLFSLSAGTEIRLIASRDDWIRIQLSDNRQGWLPENTVETVKKP